MNLLGTLSAQTLIGSDRRTPEIPKTTGALSDTLQCLASDTTSVETQVLRAAGIICVYSYAGYEPPTNVIKLPPPSLEEKQPVLQNDLFINCLQQLIKDGQIFLVKEAFELVRQKQYILPAKFLPDVLALGKNNPSLVDNITTIIGQRGTWLAQFNKDWLYIEDQNQVLDRNLWENGLQEQRILFISHLRKTNPAEALELIAEKLGELDARNRLALVETVQINLTFADEMFLEDQLKDRSKEVRNLAASLLSALPESGFVKRMQDRLHNFLSQEKKFVCQHWVLQAPELFASEWFADAIEEKRPQSEALGEKAWWLFQIARAIPLNWWEKKTELTPEELIDWALASDSDLALLRAWYQSLVREGNPAWAKAFLEKMPSKKLTIDTLALAGFLPQKLREKHWLEFFKVDTTQGRHGELLSRIVQRSSIEHSSEKMSAGFASAIINTVKLHLLDDATKWDYPLRQSLIDFICLIPQACFEDATQNWPLDNPKIQFFSETIARLLAVIEQRKILFEFSSSELL